MALIHDQTFEGERALYQTRNASIERCVFHDGESPLKESHDVHVADSVFRWRYPLWYCTNASVEGSLWLDTCRAPLWYTNHLTLTNNTFQAPKGIRRCADVVISDTNFPNAQETLWNCRDVTATRISVNGDYFAKDCENLHIDGLDLTGKYPFDGCRHVVVENARMVTKDAFWNCEDVIVRNSFISGEYLAWNTRSLTLEHCVVESLQGLCYIEGLTLVDCQFVNTTLAFERCYDIDAEVRGHVDSIANPGSGVIRAGSVGELIQDYPEMDASRVEVILEGEGHELSVEATQDANPQHLALVG